MPDYAFACFYSRESLPKIKCWLEPIVDELGETLIGVSVLNKTTGEGTITAIDGSFSLSGKQNDLIQFSYIGYASVDYVVKQEENIRVVLKEDTQNLEEVVVVGYSAQKKSSLTGAIAPVNMDDMEKRRVATVSQALQGQVAGVQITQSTGAPGDDISMLIRGEGTIGNNSPLYIIDGVPSRTMTFLNPSDISSITVLKDASAAAVYGSRASGGVVVITTKEGEVGKRTFRTELLLWNTEGCESTQDAEYSTIYGCAGNSME